MKKALHFHLRTSKEDYLAIKKQNLSQQQKATAASTPVSASVSTAGGVPNSAVEEKEGTPIKIESSSTEDTPPTKQLPLDYIDEITALLKTAFPLLTLSMETMIEQILHKLKPSTDEDIYRLIAALMNDGIQQLARDPSDSGSLSQATEMNLQRFAESMYPNHIKYKSAFEADFIKAKPTLTSLVEKFRH
jgi:transformation/transcription domain-associated protein